MATKEFLHGCKGIIIQNIVAINFLQMICCSRVPFNNCRANDIGLPVLNNKLCDSPAFGSSCQVFHVTSRLLPADQRCNSFLRVLYT